MGKRIIFEGASINYLIEGKGKTIVLIHGFLGSVASWKHFTKKLSSQFRVVAIDMPGHGNSECLKGPHSIEKMAEIVRSVLMELKVKKCTMVGHSMGGYVSLAFAKKYGKMLERICLINSTARSDSRIRRSERTRVIGVVQNNKGRFVTEVVPNLFGKRFKKEKKKVIKQTEILANCTSSEGIEKGLRAMRQRKSSIDFLKKTTIPILFLAGDDDTIIPINSVLKQVELSKNASLFQLECGHMAYLEQPGKSINTLIKFCA